MCQACLMLARRRAEDAASAEPAFGPRRPARFAAVAEWAEEPAGDPAADEPTEAGPPDPSTPA